MISAAMGAAVEPPEADSPVTALPSTNTAIAIVGLSIGANPMNHGLEKPPCTGGGPRLSGNSHTGDGGVSPGSLSHDTFHHLRQGRGRIQAHGLSDHRWGGLFCCVSVCIEHAFHQVGIDRCSVIGHRGGHHRHM